MRERFLVWSVVVLALAVPGGIVGGARMSSHHPAPAPEDEPYIEITSVTVDPVTLHTTKEPRSATVTVQFMLHGKMPANAAAKVEIGTASTDPPENHVAVTYDKQEETVPLKETPGVAKFKARVAPLSGYGKLSVAATIHGTTGGVKIKDQWQEQPRNWVADLTILTP